MNNYGAAPGGGHAANYNQGQQTSASRRYSHHQPATGPHPSQQQAAQPHHQRQPPSSHQKAANLGHYQTQDNRNSQANGDINGDGEHPQSQGAGNSSQQSYTGGGFLQNVDPAHGSSALAGMDDVFNQNYAGQIDLKSANK